MTNKKSEEVDAHTQKAIRATGTVGAHADTKWATPMAEPVVATVDAYTLELEATIRKLQSALTAQPVVPADDKATIRAVAQAIHMYHPISGGCADGACARAVIGALNAK